MRSRIRAYAAIRTPPRSARRGVKVAADDLWGKVETGDFEDDRRHEDLVALLYADKRSSLGVREAVPCSFRWSPRPTAPVSGDFLPAVFAPSGATEPGRDCLVDATSSSFRVAPSLRC